MSKWILFTMNKNILAIILPILIGCGSADQVTPFDISEPMQADVTVDQCQEIGQECWMENKIDKGQCDNHLACVNCGDLKIGEQKIFDAKTCLNGRCTLDVTGKYAEIDYANLTSCK
jgi:hypothetical protein